jgi:hypothetical protein
MNNVTITAARGSKCRPLCLNRWSNTLQCIHTWYAPHPAGTMPLLLSAELNHERHQIGNTHAVCMADDVTIKVIPR